MSADAASIARRLEGELIRPPLSVPPDVCPTCMDWADATPMCTKCSSAQAILGEPPSPVVPISLYFKPSPMRDRLTYYKDPRGSEDAALPVEVAAIVETFYSAHGGELAARYGRPDAAVVVPPKGMHEMPHPLQRALEALPARSLPPIESPLVLGGARIDRRAPHPKGFVAIDRLGGRSFLVMDDVYTTGATAQSAAHALRAAGATVTAILVVGRRLNPDRLQEVAKLLERQRATPFSFRRSPWEP